MWCQFSWHLHFCGEMETINKETSNSEGYLVILGIRQIDKVLQDRRGLLEECYLTGEPGGT
jgi:hypothetical protein